MSMKISTGLKDVWGQEIFLGDLVVDVNSGNYLASRPAVVTKVGNAKNIQINAASYSKPENKLVVTTQYVHFNGQQAHEELLDKYQIDATPVKPKSISPRYVVAAKECYNCNGNEFAVVQFFDTVDGRPEKVHKLQAFGFSLYAHTLDKRKRYRDTERFEFNSGNSYLSLKKLKEYGAELGIDFTRYIDSKITDPAAISILEKLV